MSHVRIPQAAIDLYDRFTHGGLNRRAFIDRLAAITGSTGAAMALLQAMRNDYAKADTVAADDARLSASTLEFDVGGAKASGYWVRPSGSGDRKLPAVIVIHENRGLNPHIRDVTRRVALEGFAALGIDFLSLIGGTPTDEDKARDMIGTRKAPDIVAISRAAIAMLKARADVNGKVGVVGFCWGGGAVNSTAVADPTLDAGVAYYGMQPKAELVGSIRAPLLLHYAGLDDRINAGIPAYEAALKAAGKSVEIHVYPGVNHAFNNDTAGVRYDKAAADLAWGRTIAFLKTKLA